MAEENTRINLKHYIGKPFRSDGFAILTALGVALGGGISVGVNITDNQSLAPDTEGTALQEEAYQSVLSSINALEEGKTALEIVQKKQELGALTGDLTDDALTQSTQELSNMRRDFAFQSQGVLMDMLMHGTPGSEADISEQKVVELANIFTKKVGPTSDFGVPLSVDKIAYLDETRQDMGKDGYSGNPLKDVQKLAASMGSEVEDDASTGFLAGFGTFLMLLIASVIASTKIQRWGREPRRVPTRAKKKALKH